MSVVFDRPIIAVDIGTSSVKVARVDGKHTKNLRSLGLEVLPPKIVDEGIILDREKLKELIKSLLKRLKIPILGGKVAVSLSGGAVIIKRVSLAKARSDPDFYEYLYHEAEQYLQYDVADLYLDWVNLPQASGEGGTPVLLVGAKRAVVEEYTTLFDSIGLKIGLIDCDVLATINTMLHNTRSVDNFVAIVNVGHSGTQISFLVDGHFAFSRDISIGGNDYTMSMVESLGLDLESAETLKITMSQGDRAPSEEFKGAVTEINNNLAYEIRSTIEYYFQSGESFRQEMELKKIYLLGGGCRILGLDAAITENLQVAVEYINPFQRININTRKFSPQFLVRQGHMFGVAMGMGIRRLDDKKG